MAPHQHESSLGYAAKRVLGIIREAASSGEAPPSIQEIGEQAGLSSTSSVHYHVKRLISLGFIESKPGKCRSLRPVR